MMTLTTELSERFLAWRHGESQKARYMRPVPEYALHALARRVEEAVVTHLRDCGYFVAHTPYKEHYDLLVNGVRVEVKAARLSRGRQRYQANLHRNDADVLIIGVEEPEQRFYVIPFDKVRGLKSIAVWPSGNGRWSQYLGAWEILGQMIERGVNHLQSPLWREESEESK